MEKPDQIPHINVDFFEGLTGEISEARRIDPDEIGKRIQTLRRERSLNLRELSHLTGFSENFLKRIETGAVQPQLGTVMKLSKALDGAFGRIVSGIGDRLYAITRRNERKIVRRSTSTTGQRKTYTYKSLAPEVKGRHMEALIVQLETDPEQTPSVHEGEEFIYVLAGEVYLKIAEDAHTLYPGDSAYYLSTTPHVICATKEKATIVAVVYG